MTNQEKIEKVCDALKIFLLEKNKRYKNSALEPINIFSKLPPEEGIKVRIDDKLKRILNCDTNNLRKNDIIDFMGYLSLLCILKEWLDFSDLID